ncbi:MAG: hypothetical protein JW888_16885, partial [Pirellulales bacterium]|nr:hypothetical protein [Pirellulales bacterium]
DLELMLPCLPRSRDFGPYGAPGRAEHVRHWGTAALCPSHPEPIPDPPRLGTLGGFWETTADENIRQALDAALEKLSAAGATLVPLETEVDFSRVRPMHWRIMSVEAAAVHRDDYAKRPEAYGPLLSQFLDQGLAISAVDYAAALTELRDFQRRVVGLFDAVDAVVVPSTHTTAPATLTTLTGTSEFQAPWSAAGVPVVSVPCGLAGDGLPAAVQLVGRYHSERSLLALGRWCETVFAFDNVPPIARAGQGGCHAQPQRRRTMESA